MSDFVDIYGGIFCDFLILFTIGSVSIFAIFYSYWSIRERLVFMLVNILFYLGCLYLYYSSPTLE